MRWHDEGVNTRRIFGIALLALSLALGGGFVSSTAVFASTPPSDTQQDTQQETQAPTTENDFMNLERDVTTCISSNPLPDCGRQPLSSSDRGGWQQLLLFFIMFLGMSIIFYRVYRSIRARDKDMI